MKKLFLLKLPLPLWNLPAGRQGGGKLVQWILVISIFFLSSNSFAAPQCIDWPKVFAQQKVDEAIRKKEIISVGPFLNDTGQPADDWVGQGIADLLIRYLKTDPHLGVLTRADARLLPPEHPAQYRVEGMYQNIKGWLRGFIQLQDGKGKLLAQFVVETPFPGHKDFFVDLREAAGGILKKLERKKIDAKTLKTIQNETDKVPAYENYIKGKTALETFEPSKVEVALVLFHESPREDPHYPMAYFGFMEAYGFMSLDRKQRDEPYNQDLENIEATLRAMKKQSHASAYPMESPYVGAYADYIDGIRALAKGDGAQAVKEFGEAIQKVPQDAMNAYYLSQAYATLKEYA